MTNSDQLITPEVWGPHGWKFIHYVTIGYPENPTPAQKEKYKAFLVLLKDVLPCSLCANHYGENLKKEPLTDQVMNSRENLIKWGINIHNVVNEMKGKPIIKYTDAIKSADTNVQCKPVIKEVANNINTNTDTITGSDTDSDVETLYKIETFTNEKVKNPNKTNKKKWSVNNINIVYGMVGLLVALVFIAVIYKKK
jgi:hypothetical protein